MKKSNLSALILLILSIGYISCAQDKKTEKPDETIELISIEELEKSIISIQLVDVRTPEEYKEGHIKNAENMNVKDNDFLDQMSKLDKDEPVYVYCKFGGRSTKAANQLKSAGYKKIYNLKGGIKQWIAEGKEISKTE